MRRLVLGLALVVGCQSAEDEIHAPPSLRIWVEASDYFTAADVMAGCAAWSVVGVTCEVVATEAEADTWVRSYEADEDVYARGGVDGGIIVNVLHANFIGTPLLAVILAHELGHRMGLWHIPDGETGVMSAHPTVDGPWLMVADLREYEASR